MKIDYTPCYILHRRNFSESSFILEIFSRDYGRINLIAKCAKKRGKLNGGNSRFCIKKAGENFSACGGLQNVQKQEGNSTGGNSRIWVDENLLKSRVIYF